MALEWRCLCLASGAVATVAATFSHIFYLVEILVKVLLNAVVSDQNFNA